MSTYAQAITSARSILNDGEAPYQWTDDHLTSYANDGLAVMLILRPDLFTAIETHTCTLGAVQTLASDVYRVMEVFCVVGGATVTEVPREALDRFSPTWMSATAGTPVNWARNPRANGMIFVSPPATAGVSLLLQNAKIPTRVATANIASTALPISDAHFPVLVDYIVGRAEMRDDEHANDKRAEQMMASAMQLLSVGVQSKAAVDREDAAIQGSDKVAKNG